MFILQDFRNALLAFKDRGGVELLTENNVKSTRNE
jgi:hypothetical protein